MTPTQVFPCEYCEIFYSTYFEEHLQAAASEKTASLDFWWQFRIVIHSSRAISWTSFRRSDHCTADIYLFKFNHGHTRTVCEIYSRVKDKENRTTFTPISGVSIVDLEHVNASRNDCFGVAFAHI